MHKGIPKLKTLETFIQINASPQTVWSILDDLQRYSEWNALVPELSGLTIVGQQVVGRLVQPNTPEIPLSPVLTNIVGARELRWISVVPGDEGFSAEHYFILSLNKDGGTDLVHNEDFDGPAIAFMWDNIDTNGRDGYNQMNVDLKARAEAFGEADISLHPAVDGGVSSASSQEELKLHCKCDHDQIEVSLSRAITHNHLCGCSQCWKPDGALLAQTAVVPRGALQVSANEHKLCSPDASQKILRHACSECGVHMFGRVEDEHHHFFGLEFVHPELASEPVAAPEFAGFVSSLIESGTSPSKMEAIRKKLKGSGIEPFDAFSSELMDLIAWHKVKLKNTM